MESNSNDNLDGYEVQTLGKGKFINDFDDYFIVETNILEWLLH